MSGIVIIPYRDREEHLKTFLHHFREYTKHQFSIFIIEQEPGKLFNRGKLFNVGVDIILKRFQVTTDKKNRYSEKEGPYFILHDVDMIPTTAFYHEPPFPTHIATQCSQFDYKMPCSNYFGGVVLISPYHYKYVNGFSNRFWGWGAEDDEFRNRLLKRRVRLQSRQCRFECLPHPRPVNWPDYHELKKTGQPLPEDFKRYEVNMSFARNPDLNEGLSTVDYTINHESSFDSVIKYQVSI